MQLPHPWEDCFKGHIGLEVPQAKVTSGCINALSTLDQPTVGCATHSDTSHGMATLAFDKTLTARVAFDRPHVIGLVHPHACKLRRRAEDGGECERARPQ